MTTTLWIIAGLIAAAVGWFAFKVVVGMAVKPETSGLAYLKQQLKQRGVNTSRIPDAALMDLVNLHVLSTQTMASLKVSPRDMEWRGRFIERLDMEVRMIEAIMAGDRGPDVKDFTAWNVLVKYGVIKE